MAIINTLDKCLDSPYLFRDAEAPARVGALLAQGRDLLGAARDAVAEFAAALPSREVPVSADLGRRAADLLAAEGGDAGRALSRAAARAYRVPVLEHAG